MVVKNCGCEKISLENVTLTPRFRYLASFAHAEIAIQKQNAYSGEKKQRPPADRQPERDVGQGTACAMTQFGQIQNGNGLLL